MEAWPRDVPKVKTEPQRTGAGRGIAGRGSAHEPVKAQEMQKRKRGRWQETKRRLPLGNSGAPKRKSN